MELLKKYLCNTFIGIILLLNIGCVNHATNNRIELQKIEFNSSEIFPQGGSFILFAQNNQCVLQGESYSDYGNFKYKYYFNGNQLIDATIIQNKYEEPLFVNSTPRVNKSIVTNLSNDTNIIDSFTVLLSYIKSDNLKKCS